MESTILAVVSVFIFLVHTIMANLPKGKDAKLRACRGITLWPPGCRNRKIAKHPCFLVGDGRLAGAFVLLYRLELPARLAMQEGAMKLSVWIVCRSSGSGLPSMRRDVGSDGSSNRSN